MCPLHSSMRLLCPRLAWLLSLLLLVGLSACGPAPSDEASNLGVPANAAGGGLIPFRAPREVSIPLGTGTVAGGNVDSLQDRLVTPDWMAKDLDSPDVRVRLKALETWGQSAFRGSVDPLILALEDKDERVQARAQAAKPETEQ